MLLQLHDRLNLESSIEASFWAICLVAFYGMFRKSHLLPMSPTSFDPRKQLTKADFKIFPRVVLTNIRWSNTIQYHGRVEVSLPCIPRSPLFPTAAIVNALRFTASGSKSLFTRHDFVACDKLTIGLRHDLRVVSEL